MDRKEFYQHMEQRAQRDYELYLKTDALFQAQKPFPELVNEDELQFQIVHQVEELWMKLINYTVLNAIDWLDQKKENRFLTLMLRVHRTLQLMTDQLKLLETMSPFDYQKIRLQLGNGSGQESPGFRAMMKISPRLWQCFEKNYLQERSVKELYDEDYRHDGAYMVGEALFEYDELIQNFRYHHMQLIARSIGVGAKSLKGRSVQLLESGVKYRFFPELLEVRNQMTDEWGGAYGVNREALAQKKVD